MLEGDGGPIAAESWHDSLVGIVPVVVLHLAGDLHLGDQVRGPQIPTLAKKLRAAPSSLSLGGSSRMRTLVNPAATSTRGRGAVRGACGGGLPCATTLDEVSVLRNSAVNASRPFMGVRQLKSCPQYLCLWL